MKRLALGFLATGLVTVAVVASNTGAIQKSTAPSHATAVPPLRALGAITPRISPDGESVAFSYQGAIWRMPVTGGTMRRLSGGAGFDIEPAWSPDAMRIAYINTSATGFKLQLASAQDGTPVKPPLDISVRGKLYFHPDGRRLLGNFQFADIPPALMWLDLTNGDMQPVASPPRPVGHISLSPDAAWVAAVTTLDVPGQQGGNDGPQSDLWRIAGTGGRAEKIVRFPARIHDTCWSADGLAIYVTTEVGGAHYDLWKVPLSDPLRGMQKLTFGQGDEDRPSTSTDGRRLLYTDNRNGATALVVRDLQSGGEQTLPVTGIDFATPTGTVALRTVEVASGEPVVARVMIRGGDGKFHAPAGALYRVIRNNTHFYCNGRDELVLPAGRYALRAFRGLESHITHQEFEVTSGEQTEVTVLLKRWTFAAGRGWYSGENHIHANYGYGEWYNTPESMLLQCEGEDLNVCNFMVANSDGDGVFDREFFRGRPDPLSKPRTILYWNEEYRSTLWGHMTLVNLSHVVEPIFTGFWGTTNPWDVPTNGDIADRTHLQNGLVNYTHPAANVQDPYNSAYSAKGMPVDVALGKIDTVDVMGTGYRATVPLWYRLLNCGFRLPASAGTDCFLNRIQSRLPGAARAYVKIDGTFSYAGWIDGLRAGRSFVSNGPMLELTVQGKGLGETVRPTAGKVHVQAKASSQFEMSQVELVYNGKVIATGELEDRALESSIDGAFDVERGGWLALRASGPAHADHLAGEIYAHTSPIYVEASGRPQSAADDAKYFLAWIDRLENDVQRRSAQRKRIPSPQFQQHVGAQLDAARKIFQEIVDTQ